MKKLIITAICTAMLLTGCASTRPSDDVAYQQAVNTAVKNETVKFNSRGVWHPNQSKTVIRPIFMSPQMIDGNLTITDKAIYFLEWDDDAKEYNTVYHHDIKDIEKVKQEKLGFGQKVFIKSKTTWDGFTGPEIEQAYNYLKTVIPENASK